MNSKKKTQNTLYSWDSWLTSFILLSFSLDKHYGCILFLRMDTQSYACRFDLWFSSVAQSCLTLTERTAAYHASLSITSFQSLLKLKFIELVMPSNHLTLCRPLLLLPSTSNLSIRIFSNESVLHIRWPKYWSLSPNISPSNEYSGLISLKIDWFYLLTVQETKF